MKITAPIFLACFKTGGGTFEILGAFTDPASARRSLPECKETGQYFVREAVGEVPAEHVARVRKAWNDRTTPDAALLIREYDGPPKGYFFGRVEAWAENLVTEKHGPERPIEPGEVRFLEDCLRTQSNAILSLHGTASHWLGIPLESWYRLRAWLRREALSQRRELSPETDLVDIIERKIELAEKGRSDA